MVCQWVLWHKTFPKCRILLYCFFLYCYLIIKIGVSIFPWSSIILQSILPAKEKESFPGFSEFDLSTSPVYQSSNEDLGFWVCFSSFSYPTKYDHKIIVLQKDFFCFIHQDKMFSNCLWCQTLEKIPGNTDTNALVITDDA